jgi:hypothetical protein
MDKLVYSAVLLPFNGHSKFLTYFSSLYEKLVQLFYKSRNTSNDLEIKAQLLHHFLWVHSARSAEFLWINAFYGKGCLSRSQPTHMLRKLYPEDESLTTMKTLRNRKPKFRIYHNAAKRAVTDDVLESPIGEAEFVNLSFMEAFWLSYHVRHVSLDDAVTEVKFLSSSTLTIPSRRMITFGYKAVK